jgi:hypothetical protein
MDIGFGREPEPIKRAHSPLLAAGLASVYKISLVPCGAAKLCRQGEHSPWLAAGRLQWNVPELILPDISSITKGAYGMTALEKIVELLTSIDTSLSAIRTSVFDVDEINALLREILKEVKK